MKEMSNKSSKKSFNAETYWEDRLTKRYDLDGVGYTGLSRSYNQWLYRVRRHNFHRVASKYDLPDNPKVLDIGSGTGFYVDQWHERGAEHVTGIDITTAAVRGLRQKYPNDTFAKHDISNPLPDSHQGPFDVISAMDVLFHIVDDKKYQSALKNLYKVLSPSGYMLFTDNFLNRDAIKSKHIVHRELSTIRSSVKAAGFSIEERCPIFVLMNEPVDTESRLLRHYWSRLYRAASHSESVGYIVGAVLFPLEITLARVLTESPTTEMMVCRKPIS